MALKLAQSIRKFLFSYDWEIVEVQGSVFKIMWGFWLLLPFQTFRAVQGYNAAGTENWWGIGLLFYGLLHFFAVMSGNITFRKYLTFGGFLFWLFTIFLIGQQNITAALLPMFGVIAFFMGLNFIRLSIMGRVDQRNEDQGPPTGIPERRNDGDDK